MVKHSPKAVIALIISLAMICGTISYVLADDLTVSGEKNLDSVSETLKPADDQSEVSQTKGAFETDPEEFFKYDNSEVIKDNDEMSIEGKDSEDEPVVSESPDVSAMPDIPGSDEDAKNAAVDKNALSLPKTVNTENVTEDFDLSIKGEYGSKINWTSSDESVISVDEKGHATVNRPKYSGAGYISVTLTAHIVNGSASSEKSFILKVAEKNLDTDVDKAEYDAENALIGGVDLNNVRQSSFFLPDKGIYGILSWSSSNTDFISIEKTKPRMMMEMSKTPKVIRLSLLGP